MEEAMTEQMFMIAGSRYTPSGAWLEFVGEESPADFMEGHADDGITDHGIIYTAVQGYVLGLVLELMGEEELPREDRDALEDALFAHIRNTLENERNVA
jgi:hypothetical protein